MQKSVITEFVKLKKKLYFLQTCSKVHEVCLDVKRFSNLPEPHLMFSNQDISETDPYSSERDKYSPAEEPHNQDSYNFETVAYSYEDNQPFLPNIIIPEPQRPIQAIHNFETDQFGNDLNMGHPNQENHKLNMDLPSYDQDRLNSISDISTLDYKLLQASRSGDEKVVMLLIKSGAIVNASYRGSTALHEAAKGGHPEILQVLIESGADVNTEGRDGMPLHVAIKNAPTKLHFLMAESSKGPEVSHFLF